MQTTFGDFCLEQVRKYEFLATGVPDEYEPGVLAQAAAWFDRAAEWGQPEAVAAKVREPVQYELDFSDPAECRCCCCTGECRDPGPDPLESGFAEGDYDWV